MSRASLPGALLLPQFSGTIPKGILASWSSGWAQVCSPQEQWVQCPCWDVWPCWAQSSAPAVPSCAQGTAPCTELLIPRGKGTPQDWCPCVQDSFLLQTGMGDGDGASSSQILTLKHLQKHLPQNHSGAGLLLSVGTMLLLLARGWGCRDAQGP